MGGESRRLESKSGFGHMDCTGHGFAGLFLAILSLVRLSTHSMAAYMHFVMRIRQSAISIASHHLSLVLNQLLTQNLSQPFSDL